MTTQSDQSGYRVLARKYRPATFDDLIGQDAMVRTISNAFEAGRIPQAWILTGVRGVGKTTTARILARALNYELPDGSVTAPTVNMPVLGVHCRAIMESEHLDVLEMDAASHTGIDDVRQITDSVRYAPSTSRYKVYIIDEVHMLSDKAFNAFLKTIEEPPPHAKFVFATTEIRKVPVTVLSRCQRFDLRRVDAGMLVKHLEGIAKAESIEVEPAALGLIARAAEGSVRDSLSLFDQAIAHAAGIVKAEDVQQMLGLADRTRTIDLFEAVMRGDMPAALGELRAQYDIGADPGVALSDLAEFTHFVTRVKVVPAVADDVSYAETERKRARAFAEKLSMRVLSRAWQMLLKGITEVEESGRPLAAAEMVLIRIAYAADLPTPDEVIRALDGNGAVPVGRAGNGGGAIGTGASAVSRARADAQRSAARRAACCARAGAADRRPCGSAVGGCSAHTCHQPLRGSDRARRPETRSGGQGGARARRAAGRLRGWTARRGARTKCRQDPGQRSRAQVQPMDRAALGGGGIRRSRAADGEVAIGCPTGGAEDRGAGRSAGAGGTGALPGSRNRRGAHARAERDAAERRRR